MRLPAPNERRVQGAALLSEQGELVPNLQTFLMKQKIVVLCKKSDGLPRKRERVRFQFIHVDKANYLLWLLC